MSLRKGEGSSEERGDGVFVYDTKKYLDTHPTASVFVQMEQVPLSETIFVFPEDILVASRRAAEAKFAGLRGVLEEAQKTHPDLTFGHIRINGSFELTGPSSVIKSLAVREDVKNIGLQSLGQRPRPRNVLEM